MTPNRYQCRHCGCMTQADSPEQAAASLDRFRPCTHPTRRHTCKRYIQPCRQWPVVNGKDHP